ncbi:MAG: drug/metabolite exporter YedA [Bacteroidota bacterium]|jgi:drug/metabolite transporter (DMT)-like permease|nr:drug/metabolite exporter YedA [Bacteroidota bacterium]
MHTSSSAADRGQTTKVLMAFAAVYVIWGSTYLGIRFAVETIPPFLMAGARFAIAGAVLYAWLRMRGAPPPTRRQWRETAIVGALLIGAGNGAVSWAEQTVPSGLTALIIALTPLWFVAIEWRRDAVRPTREVVLGLVLGLVGMVVLIDPARLANSGHVDPMGTVAIVGGTIAWAAGSMYSRTAELPARPLLGTAMQMFTGGLLLLVLSPLSGELATFHPAEISDTSLIALVYLIVFGSLIAFTSYIWLLKAASPARVATYAYVNPVIAVFLGWLLADELLNGRIAIAAAIIVAGVAMITAGKSHQGTRPATPTAPE